MIRNVTLKKALKETVFKTISVINKLIPKDDRLVLLYSANGGICHSLIPLRKYLLDNHFYDKYDIICGIENLKYADNECRVCFASRLSAYMIFLRAGHVFYTAGQIPIKPSKRQCVVHLKHGNTNFKNMGKRTKINNGDEFYFTYMCATSPYFRKIMSEEYGCPENNIVVVGDPLVDQFFDPQSPVYDFSEYNKILLWLPTFRKSDYLGYDDSIEESLVPLFSESEYGEINDYLAKHKIKLIVKIHPAQNNFGSNCRHFKFFEVYTNREFIEAGYELYPLMKQSDALVGDYSSASMQYLVTDKPQGYVIPDINEYALKRGFIFENPEDYMAGHIIKTKEDFFTFVDDIANNRDIYREKRKRVRREMYSFPDDRNCKRIIELSGMRI